MYQPTIDAGLTMTARDGVTFTADLYRPAGNGPWPTIVHRTPYDRTSPFFISGILTDPVWLARQGFAVLVQDTRGRFASGGEFEFVFQEYNDSYDTVEWAAAQSWSTGEVGIYGSSYVGMVVLQAVAAQIPHLKAAAALAGTVDMKHTARPGGLFESGFLTLYGLGLIFAGLDHSGLTSEEQARAVKQLQDAFADRDGVVSQLPLTSIEPLADGRLAPFWAQWLREVTDDSWETQNVLADPSLVNIPFLQVSGYRDFLTPSQFRLAEKLGGNPDARFVAGPWTHLGTYMVTGEVGQRVLPDANAGVNTWGPVLASFFDRHLRGGDGSDYPVAENYLGGTDPVRYYVGGTNSWRSSAQWPPTGRQREWSLSSGGDARSSAGDGVLLGPGDNGSAVGADTFTADPLDPFPTHGGVLLFEGEGASHPEGIQDQRVVDGRSDVLVYTTEPLIEDITIGGQPEVSVWLSSTAPDADVCITLVDVEPEGYAMNVSEGAQRARYRNGHNDDWLRPGAVENITIRLHDVAHTFVAGHRIRIQLAGASFPRLSRNLHTTTVPELGTLDEAINADHTVHHGADHLSVLRMSVLDR